MKTKLIPPTTLANAQTLLSDETLDFDVVRIVDIQTSPNDPSHQEIICVSKNRPPVTLQIPTSIALDWHIGDTLIYQFSAHIQDAVQNVIAPNYNLDDTMGPDSFLALKELLEEKQQKI